MPKFPTARRLLATREARKLATRFSPRNRGKALAAALAASPNLDLGSSEPTASTAGHTPVRVMSTPHFTAYETPIEEKSFEFPPVGGVEGPSIGTEIMETSCLLYTSPSPRD